MRVRRSLFLAACAVAASAVAGDVAPIEAHANAGFDLDVAGVVLGDAPAGGLITWSPVDLSGRAGSGSLAIAGPAGRYVVSLCLHPSVPPGAHAHELSLGALATDEATLFAELIPMFGGDSPDTDAPCARPWTGYASTGGRFTGAASFRARIARVDAAPDVRLVLVLHKGAATLLVDDWSLVLEPNPLVADGFE